MSNFEETFIIAKDAMKLHNTVRKDTKSLDVPEITVINDLKKLNKLPTDKKSGIDNHILLTQSDCFNIEKTLESGKFKCVIVNETYFFSKKDIDTLKNVHRIEEIKESLVNEEKWLRDATFRVPHQDFRVDPSIIEKFAFLCQNGKDGKSVKSINGSQILTSDLCLLLGRNWIPRSLIEHLAYILNKQQTSALIFSYQYLFLERTTELEELVKKWVERKVETLIVITNVRKDKLSQTFIGTNTKNGNPGNHWTTLAFDLKSGRSIYVDSLGWKIPEELSQKLQEFAGTIRNYFPSMPSEMIRIESAHCTKTHDGPKTSKCSRDCYDNTPYQGINGNICGVVSFLTAVVFSKNLELIYDQKAFPVENKWLLSIYNHVEYARYVLMKWYWEERIDEADITYGVCLQESDERAKMEGVIENQVAASSSKLTQVKNQEEAEILEDGHGSTVSMNGWQAFVHDNWAYNAKGKNGIRVEPCPKCGATFDKIFRRNEHVERCNRVFNCERCGKPFKSKQALTGHFNGKHTEKFKCESCGKCFESSSKLDRHKRTHDEAKNFTCSQCGKTFKRNDNMVKHIRVIHKV
ncbi:uncharacterized protein [Clytia hemisphaerica]|uniref:uncharacterized protein n=1 Tax=Clytia hemisphaerica TaxID=252671 RepID=UPI0034D674A9